MEVVKIQKTYTSFKRQEFVEYFKSIGTTEDNRLFSGDGWKAEVHEEEKTIRFNLEFTCVNVEFEINEDIYEEFSDRLRRAFLRGGG